MDRRRHEPCATRVALGPRDPADLDPRADDAAHHRGAVRGLIREAGDSVDGALVISCAIVGDVAQPDARVTVEVAISALYGVAVQPLANDVRDAVARHLLQQTELVVESVDVTVRDVHQLDDEADGGL